MRSESPASPALFQAPLGADTRAAWILVALMVLLPTMGAPMQVLLLQDTFKSALLVFATLTAAVLFFWPQRDRPTHVVWHQIMWLPGALMLYALASMAWSHAYLAGVEAVRWFVLGLLLVLGANTLTPLRMTHLAWGIHIGAVLGALWAGLQFWFDLRFFPQGPMPASTFGNRNFFAEYLVCTLPFSSLLLLRVRSKLTAALIVGSIGLNIVALMMVGARATLVGAALLGLLIPAILMGCRSQFASGTWRWQHALGLVALLLASVVCLGAIDTGNAKLIEQGGRFDALDRAFSRTLSMARADEYNTGSFSVRKTLWSISARMALDAPVLGVGAGAWEIHSPRYGQTPGLVEVDFFAHNEPLQLVAEYGIVGWGFLTGMLGYLVLAARRTWQDETPLGRSEAPARALVLCSLLVLLLASGLGFPWHMAATGAMLALCISALAASDFRLNRAGLAGKPLASRVACNASTVFKCVGLLLVPAIYVAWQAVAFEGRLLRAMDLSNSLTGIGAPGSPPWLAAKDEIVTLTREGLAIHPNNRKLSAVIAYRLARLGDWDNALWILETNIRSNPHVPALLAAAARGQMYKEKWVLAQHYIDRARQISPTAFELEALELLLWSYSGRAAEARARTEQMLRAGVVNQELFQAAYRLGLQDADRGLAILALEAAIRAWPASALDNFIKLGELYHAAGAGHEDHALAAYRSALRLAPPLTQAQVLSRIPPPYAGRLR